MKRAESPLHDTAKKEEKKGRGIEGGGDQAANVETQLSPVGKKKTKKKEREEEREESGGGSRGLLPCRTNWSATSAKKEGGKEGKGRGGGGRKRGDDKTQDSISLSLSSSRGRGEKKREKEKEKGKKKGKTPTSFFPPTSPAF